MNGKQFISFRPKQPEKWQDISCGPLEVAVDVFTGLFVLGIIAGVLLWCMK